MCQNSFLRYLKFTKVEESEMNINLLSIDIAKNVFQLCGVDQNGKILSEKKVSRAKLIETVNKWSPNKIAMEACGSANYWSREFMSRDIEVNLISPQYVKPFVKGNKNDKQDARAIAEAAQRPNMHFVSAKTVEQQDMQSLLRIREGHIEIRTKICNQMRGLLAEYGIIVAKGVSQLRNRLPSIFDRKAENGLTARMKGYLEMQYTLLLTIDEKIDMANIDVKQLVKENDNCRRIQGIEGVGEITAVAIIAHIGNGSAFKNGRHLSAYLGLVPRQHSSGNKQQLLGISKRGDKYIRKLLVHGGRSVVRVVDKKNDKRSCWVKRIKNERGKNKANVAVANKNARIILAMLKSGEEYRKAA